MGVKLNSAGGGSVSIDVPSDVTSDFTLNVPAKSGTLDTLTRTGNIVQIATGTTDTDVLVNTATWTDIGLQAAITPQYANSLLIIQATIQMYTSRSSSNSGGGVRLLRNNNEVWGDPNNGTGPLGMYESSGSTTSHGCYNRHAVMYFDTTHNSTSELIFKFQGRPYLSSNSGAVRFQYNMSPTNGSSFITIMEVKV